MTSTKRCALKTKKISEIKSWIRITEVVGFKKGINLFKLIENLQKNSFSASL